MRSLSFVFLSLIVACKPSEETGDTSDTIDTSETGDTSDTEDVPCTAEVGQVIPLDGSLGVGVDEGFTVSFTESVRARDVTVALTNFDGAAVTATLALAGDGLSGAITHDTLDESTSYTLRVDACESTQSSVFTTTAGPVDESIEHGTYALDYEDVEFVSPGWASVFKNQLPLEYVLVEILDVDIALQELDAVGAIGFFDEDTSQIYQGACYDPMIYENVDFSENPSFQVGPSDLYIPNGNLTLYNLRIQAAFDDGGNALVGIDITGQIDSRQIMQNIDIDACQFAEAAGEACIPCESDGEPECLDLWLAADQAPYVAGLDIDEFYDADTDYRCGY